MHYFFSFYCDPHFEFFCLRWLHFHFLSSLQFQSETKRKEKKMDIEKDLLDGFSSWTTIICGGISLSLFPPYLLLSLFKHFSCCHFEAVVACGVVSFQMQKNAKKNLRTNTLKSRPTYFVHSYLRWNCTYQMFYWIRLIWSM